MLAKVKREGSLTRADLYEIEEASWEERLFMAFGLFPLLLEKLELMWSIYSPVGSLIFNTVLYRMPGLG